MSKLRETTHAVAPAKPAAAKNIRATAVDELGEVLASMVIDEPVLVGTSDVCGIKLDDPTVSRRHVLLEPSPFGVRVRDEHSRNGTWLDESRIFDAELPAGVELTLGKARLRLEAAGDSEPRKRAASKYSSFGRFRGVAPCLDPVYAQLEKAAGLDVTVLLEGESGTGKELLAEAVHERSQRHSGPFVVVDCGAISETLIESELFGHEKGAFTGADRQRIGAFEEAQGGTIFLDEIGELPLSLQTRLLRVLDRKHLKRVGSQETIAVDVRVVAATNKNLDHEVEEGRFRLDLFHRLAVVLIRVPPLRERAGDVEFLARQFAKDLGAPDALDPEVLDRLQRHRWPGNVRELRNHVERLVLLGDTAPPLVPEQPKPEEGFDPATAGMPYRQARAVALDDFTRRYVEDMLGRHDGNVSHAARAAGIARRHFQRLKAKE